MLSICCKISLTRGYGPGLRRISSKMSLDGCDGGGPQMCVGESADGAPVDGEVAAASALPATAADASDSFREPL